MNEATKAKTSIDTYIYNMPRTRSKRKDKNGEINTPKKQKTTPAAPVTVIAKRKFKVKKVTLNTKRTVVLLSIKPLGGNLMITETI